MKDKCNEVEYYLKYLSKFKMFITARCSGIKNFRYTDMCWSDTSARHFMPIMPCQHTGVVCTVYLASS